MQGMKANESPPPLEMLQALGRGYSQERMPGKMKLCKGMLSGLDPGSQTTSQGLMMLEAMLVTWETLYHISCWPSQLLCRWENDS